MGPSPPKEDKQGVQVSRLSQSGPEPKAHQKLPNLSWAEGKGQGHCKEQIDYSREDQKLNQRVETNWTQEMSFMRNGKRRRRDLETWKGGGRIASTELLG